MMDARRKYPWTEWQDGNKHTVPITTFGATIKHTQDTLYMRASRTQTKVHVNIDALNDTVTFQFFDSEEDYYKTARANLERDYTNGRFTVPLVIEQREETTCTICGALIRPEWPGRVCHVKTDNKDDPDAWQSISGRYFVPKIH